MSRPSPLDVFPRRPLSVRTGWRTGLAAVGSALGALACLAGALWFASLYGPELLRDARLASAGVEAPVSRVTGGCRVRLSWLPLATCELDVSYRAPNGQAATRRLRALTFVGVDQSAPPRVRIDPTNPEAVSLSWFAQETTLRSLALLLVSGGLALLALVLGAGAWASLREARLYRSLARAPNPVAAEVLGVRLVSSPGWAREVTFRHRDADGRERTDTQRLKVLKGEHGVAPENWSYEAPVMLSPRGDTVLALAGERGARLVKRSLEPFVLTDEERRTLADAEQAAARA